MQRPAHTSPHATAPRGASRRGASGVALAATVVCAVLAALPFAGPSLGTWLAAHGAPCDRVVTASDGALAALVAPALPHAGGRTPCPGCELRSHVGRAEAAGRVDRPAVPAAVPSAPASRTPDDLNARTGVQERLARAAIGTYLGEMLRERDSAVIRWPERVDRPLTVWVGNAHGLADWRPVYLARVADAFAEWGRVGVPVRFRFVQDSGAAEVHVAWTDRFREPISGRTVWSRDDKWWITDANITLALHHNDGSPLDEEQVRAIALHEIGHLLGLDHTTDASSIMAPRVRVRELSSADQATARLIYTLPAGHL